MRKVFPFLNKKDNMNNPGKDLLIPSSATSKSSDEINKRSPSSTKKDLGGSATGNPRNKTALKPGHSLMDWIRLGSSGVDLAGTNGVITPVSSAELAKHCHQDDAWMAIRGKVYNVTKYMDFHPGGIDELKRGIGKDATTLFNQVHAWVNYEQLLSKCFVGPLRNIIHVDLEPIKPRQKATTPTPDCAENIRTNNIIDTNSNENFKKPISSTRLSNSEKNSPIKNSSSYSNENIVQSSNTDETIKCNKKQKSLAEIVPRFDWIQNTSEITLIFYTRPLLNPGLVLLLKSETVVNIRIFVNNVLHEFEFELNMPINWPCIVKLSKESGKIEIVLKKTKPQLWTIFGNMKYLNNYTKLPYDFSDSYEFEIEKCEKFNHDSFGLTLKSSKKEVNQLEYQTNHEAIIVTPVGFHLSLTALIDDEAITRSYTPVPLSYLPYTENINVSYKIAMLIKSYSNGRLARFITQNSTCNTVELPLKIQLSAPKGNFSLVKLLDHNRIALLAAGSGITPMLGILDHLLSRNNNRVHAIQLFYFNKTERDIWCRKQLDKLALRDNRFNIHYVLSDADDDDEDYHQKWHGDRGRLSKEIVQTLNDTGHDSYVTFCCVCGPKPFNDLALKLLTDVKFLPEQLHIFQG